MCKRAFKATTTYLIIILYDVTGWRWIFLGGAHERSTLREESLTAIGRLGGGSGTSARTKIVVTSFPFCIKRLYMNDVTFYGRLRNASKDGSLKFQMLVTKFKKESYSCYAIIVYDWWPLSCLKRVNSNSAIKCFSWSSTPYSSLTDYYILHFVSNAFEKK